MSESGGQPGPAGVRVEIDAGVAVITVDRPAVRNAHRAGHGGRARRRSRRGRGRRSGGAGDPRRRGPGLRLRRRPQGAVARSAPTRMRSTWRAECAGCSTGSPACPVPVIAALNGHALGGGAEVAIAADVRIAADDIRIGFNQVALGIMPAWGGAERLAETIGRGRALLAIGTGELFDAATAREWGIVDLVVPRADIRLGMARPGRPPGGDRPGDHAGGEVGHRGGGTSGAPRPGGRRGGRLRRAVDRGRALAGGRGDGSEAAQPIDRRPARGTGGT